MLVMYRLIEAALAYCCSDGCAIYIGDIGLRMSGVHTAARRRRVVDEGSAHGCQS